MVTIIKNSGEKLQTRLKRRGYSDEECTKLLKEKSNVVILKKRSFKGNSIMDSTFQNC